MSRPRALRIAGVDPGSRITGYGIVDFRGDRFVHVANGCLRIRGDDLGDRLGQIFDGLGAVLSEHGPAEMAVERVFVHRNPDSALKLGQARGAALLAGVTREIPVFEYMPNQIKQAITGRGHAAKEQIQHMVRVLLGLAQAPQSDAADALAIAICHGNVRHTEGRVQAADARAARSAAR